VLDNICQTLLIFEAWPDEDWFDAGTAVRVSLVCFGDAGLTTTRLSGQSVALIHADLTASSGDMGMDLTRAKKIVENAGSCFQGSVRVGRFDITSDLANSWLILPSNLNGLKNQIVLRPLRNAMDLVRRSRNAWIIDFNKMTENEASFFEAPFEHIKLHVKPYREKNRDESRRKRWWLHGRTGGDLRSAMSGLSRCIATPQVSKHRIFVWLPSIIFAESTVLIIARADDTTFGILHSRFHELWSLGLCTWMGKGNDPRYTPTTPALRPSRSHRG
jgi:hypothetical protein